jgi:outer membrane protein TolC
MLSSLSAVPGEAIRRRPELRMAQPREEACQAKRSEE